MKTKKYIFGTILFCASTALISCSNDGDELIQDSTEPVTERVITNINVSAPTINKEGAGDTRVTFSYDSGLKMEWEAGDGLMGTGYYQRDESTWYRSFSKSGSATTAGAQTTFSLDGWTDLSAKTTPAYTITYHPGQSTSGESHTTTWKTASISSTQSQTGNGNTEHLKTNYYAILQNINSITASDITFSSAWAASHASTKALHDGEELGKFYQNSCLKFDLMVPYQVGNKTMSSVTNLKLRLYNSDGTTSAQIQWKNDGTGTKYYEMNLTLSSIDLTGVDADNPLHLIAYVMLPIQDWTLTSGTVVNVGVEYDGGGHYFVKKMAALSSAWNLEAGKLGVIKLNSSNWNYNSWGVPSE